MSGIAKQVLSYKNRILRHYGSSLGYDSGETTYSGEEIFNVFSGSYPEASTGLRIKGVSASGNFYFTTSSGIKKISAVSASDFTTNSGYITAAGGVEAIDLTSTLIITEGNQTNWFTEDSVVAYKTVWGINDANKNLILGAPSQTSVVYNPLLSLLLNDLMSVCAALDNVNQAGSIITYGQFVENFGLPVNSTATSLWTNLDSLATQIDNSILYANDTGSGAVLTISAGTKPTVSTGVCTVTFSSGDSSTVFDTTVNNKIFLAGFSGMTGSINGAQTITGVTSTTITFNTSATGTATGITGATIVSDIFRSITPAISTLEPSEPATHTELEALQTFITSIINFLNSLPNAVVSTSLVSTYFSSLSVTTASTVSLNINIPEEVVTSGIGNYFLQIYRSNQAIATGPSILLTDITPDQEFQQVYEAFPTSAELSAGSMTVIDITLDSFKGANLYTNPNSGEGVLQANDPPPFAKDVAFFQNFTFYANTFTKQNIFLNLFGVSNIASGDKITISDGTVTNTYTFTSGRPQKTTLTCANGSGLIATALPASYFLIYDGYGNKYYVWYKVGSSIDPAVSGGTGIQVTATAGDTAIQIATKTNNAITRLLNTFSSSNPTSTTVLIINIISGYTTVSSIGTMPGGYSIATTQSGTGEKVSTKEFLLSSNISPAQAIDETSRSMIKIINATSSGDIYGFYLSEGNSTPGQMYFQGRSIGQSPFYIVANSTGTGGSFSPNISPTLTISTATVANPTVITTLTNHGLRNKDYIVITGSNSTPSIDGLHQINYISPTTFSIAVNVTVHSTIGKIIPAASGVFSTNETNVNRIYYSKEQQPEAVPFTNWQPVGAGDKAILRIFAIRNTLFIFKEDGLFILTGNTTSSFQVSLFDSSCVLLAPDSLSVSNNVLYGWTKQGISAITESGVQPTISRPIDNDILKIATYPNFSKATWGTGYESDNSYTVYTTKKISDEVATIAYRFCNLTNTWTSFDKTATCGIVNPGQDVMYLGAGDVVNIEKERKNFNRTDYADREITGSLEANKIFENMLQLTNITGIEAGDAIVQIQTLNTFTFNGLLNKLAIDTNIQQDYSGLSTSAGQDIRQSIVDLAALFDTEPGINVHNYATTIGSYSGTITAISSDDPCLITCANHRLVTGRIVTISGSNCTPSIDGTWEVSVLSSSTFTIDTVVTSTGTAGTFVTQDNDFSDIKACYNKMIANLNSDGGPQFTNYVQITSDSSPEAVITAVNVNTRQITINTPLDFIKGNYIIYKAIDSSFTYTSITAGDSLGLKHLRECTIMYENKAFTNSTLNVSSDLLPAYESVNIPGDGNGIFGIGTGTFGSGYFGGNSNSAPFRTYIPRNKQRCRYLNIQHRHKIAREHYSIVGMTVTGEVGQSSRGYR